jgi:ABC-type transporter Mla subunit MlaD
MNDATRAMIVTSMDSLSQVIIALHIRLDALETDNTKFANTVGNLPAILENLRERQQKLDDRLMALPDDETLEKLNNTLSSEEIESKIKEALENYDPTGAMQFDDRVNELINDYSDDDVADKIRSFIENKVSVEMNVSRY